MQTSLLNVSSNMQIADFDLPDAITNQQELDDIVNDWLYDVELEDLAAGKSREGCVGGFIVRAPVSSIFVASLGYCLT